MSSRKSVQKRQILLQSALNVFSKVGFTGASLDDIAQGASMHKSNIFYYYASKEALYIEVLADVLQKWLLPLQILDNTTEPEEAIKEYLIQKIETSRQYPLASKLFALEIIQGATHILPILQGPLKKQFKRKVKVIQEWQSQGKISKHIDPELFILNIWALTQNYADFAIQMEMVTGKTLKNKVMLQRSIDHTVHLMLYGALTRPELTTNTHD